MNKLKKIGGTTIATILVASIAVSNTKDITANISDPITTTYTSEDNVEHSVEEFDNLPDNVKNIIISSIVDDQKKKLDDIVSSEQHNMINLISSTSSNPVITTEPTVEEVNIMETQPIETETIEETTTSSVVESVSKVGVATPVAFNQKDPAWSTYAYCFSDKEGKISSNIGDSGCGLLAFTNAIYYLTAGNVLIQPKTIADYSMRFSCYENGVGTTHAFFEKYSAEYGSTYGFQYNGDISDKDILINHLSNGGVSIVRIPGHFMAVVDYDQTTGMFLLIDSAPNQYRNTDQTGFNWFTYDQLKQMGSDWFKLFSRI